MAAIDRLGQRYGMLVVLSRAGSNHRRSARWLCQCDCGRQKVVGGGSLARGHVRSCGCLAKAAKGVPVVNAPNYQGAHKRVWRAFGKASEFTCVECGAPAAEWAYDHEDPDELVWRGLPYSASIYHYVPMCKPCHTRFDLGRKPG